MEFGSATTTAITYGDWLFVNAIIIFLLSFIAIGLFFSPFKKK